MTKQTVLITGGTGKLGRIFTTHFANNGWRVIITSTNRARAEEFKASVSLGENIDIFISDLSQLNAPQKLVESIIGD
jgi:short-subunit dehydrogenase